MNHDSRLKMTDYDKTIYYAHSDEIRNIELRIDMMKRKFLQAVKSRFLTIIGKGNYDKN